MTSNNKHLKCSRVFAQLIGDNNPFKCACARLRGSSGQISGSALEHCCAINGEKYFSRSLAEKTRQATATANHFRKSYLQGSKLTKTMCFTYFMCAS